jgi:hypothetical protein
MDADKIKGNIEEGTPVKSTRSAIEEWLYPFEEVADPLILLRKMFQL